MNILHLALISPDNDGMIDRGFRARGHEVKRVDWRDANANEQAKALAQWADVCFYQGQGNTSITGKTLDHLRANGVFVINWTGDVRDDVKWYAAMAPHVDLTLFTNGTDIDLIREAGYKADYMQVGYDEQVYHMGLRPIVDCQNCTGDLEDCEDGCDHLIEGDYPKRSGVVFMGQNSGLRFPESRSRAAMVERMREEFGADFAVYGHGWSTKYLQPKEEADTYRRTLVALNWDHYQRPLFHSDRLLRAMACGCAVISHTYPGITEEHPIVGNAESLDDMVKMVRHALKHPDKAARIGAACAQHVRTNCQWSNRIERMEQLIEQYR